MLQFIRNMVTGWLAVVIVILLIIPFAFWGINYYFGQGVNVVAAEVNGTPISLRDYQRAYQQIRQQWQNSGITLEGREQLLKEQAVNSLVNQELLNQVRNSMGLRVSDQVVMQNIMNISMFQGGDGFDTGLYNRYLATLGYTPAEFEGIMRQDLASQQLQFSIVYSSFATDAEVERVTKLRSQTRDIDYLLVPHARFAEQVEVSEEEVKDYYAEHPDQFMEPEKVRIAYVELSLDGVAEEISVSEEELREYYQDNRADYNVEEQRRIRQILISLEDEPSEEMVAQATQQAEELLARLEAGEDFDEVIASVPESSGLQVESSDFGYLSSGILATPVDELAFSLERGGVGGPVRTDEGLHIVQVRDITGGENSTFEQVRDEVEADYRNNQAARQFYEMSETLATLTFENPNTLEAASEVLDVPVQQSEYFSRDGLEEGIPSNQDVINTAFSTEVLQSGNNSEIIELGDERYVVLRVIDHQLPARQPLDAVREEITETIRFSEASRLARETGRDIVTALRQGADQESLAAEHELEWQTAPGVSREAESVDQFILDTAFALEKPGPGKTVGGEAMSSGDYAVVVVDAVQEIGTVSVEDVQPVRAELERIRASNAWTQYLETLREGASININQQNL